MAAGVVHLSCIDLDGIADGIAEEQAKTEPIVSFTIWIVDAIAGLRWRIKY